MREKVRYDLLIMAMNERYKNAMERFDESLTDLTAALEQLAIVKVERDRLVEQVLFLTKELQQARKWAQELIEKIERMKRDADKKKADRQPRGYRHLNEKIQDLRHKNAELSAILTRMNSELNAERARKQQLNDDLKRLRESAPPIQPRREDILPTLVAGQINAKAVRSE